MMFCEKCGGILKPKSEKGKKVMHCSTCNISKKDIETATIKETVKKDQPEIEVVPEDDNTLPITDAECPKCKNGEAYYWLIQTRAGDEPETKFLKCTKCKHIWRDYS